MNPGQPLANALVRKPSPKYAAYYAPRGIAISDDLARRQHDAYVASLERSGLKVSALQGHPTHHDCVFIEDTAIVWNGHALITRMNDVREGEQPEVENWLKSQGFDIVHASPTARIEGGDVLHLDDVTLVGRSARTNDAGIEALRAFMSPFGHRVEAIPVVRCLHLKSAMTYLGDRTVLTSATLIDVELPNGYERLEVHASEPHAGNVLRINDFIFHATSFPRTAELLQRFSSKCNVKLGEIDISEAQKGDGALTCQSILW